MRRGLLFAIIMILSLSLASICSASSDFAQLPAFLSGNITATDELGENVDVPDGTVLSSYSLDGELYGSRVINNNYYNNLPIIANNITEIVKFKVGDLYAEEEYVFIPAQKLNLNLNVKNWVTEPDLPPQPNLQPDNNEETDSDEDDDDDERGSTSTRRKSSQEEIIEDAITEDTEEKTTITTPKKEEPKETKEEAQLPITEIKNTSGLLQGIVITLIIIICVLIGLGIYLSVSKKRAR